MEQPADIFDNPRPWMTEGVIQFLERNVLASDVVLEFGGGASSLWWASRVAFTYTVEAAPTWAPKLITEMAKRPSLLAKWTMLFCPSEWHSSHRSAKPYWDKRQSSLSDGDAARLEALYSRVAIAPDIIVIDGSVRPQCVDSAANYIKFNKVRMVIVDNMESMQRHVGEKFSPFTRLDFPEFDPKVIPVHQNGRWISSAFIHPSFASCIK